MYQNRKVKKVYKYHECKANDSRLANAFAATLATICVVSAGSLSYADDVRAKRGYRSTESRDVYDRPAGNPQRSANEEHQETAAEFILSFSDPVELGVLEQLDQTTDGEESVALSVEPLTWDNREWMIRMDRSIISNGRIELLFVEGEVLVFSVLPRGAGQDEDHPAAEQLGNRRLLDSIWMDGEAELIDAQPAYVDQDVIVSEWMFIDSLASLPEAVGSLGADLAVGDINLAGPFDEGALLVVLEQDGYLVDTESVAGDGDPSTARASCCRGGGMCMVFGGDGCPSGTSEVGCPCASAK